MAVKIKKDSGTKKGPLKSNRVQTIESTLRLLKEISGAEEFYELEPLEVLDVHLDDSKSSFPTLTDGSPDYSFVGGVVGRFCTSEQGLNIDKCKNYKPLNPNIHSVPAVGEIVIGVRYLGEYFFTSQINLFGNPNSNIQHGVSRLKRKGTLESEKGIETPNSDDKGVELGYYLKRTEDARRLLPNEGDVIIEGRFGNTIRIGSDIKNENEDSPNIILNAGQTIDGDTKVPVEEKIDTDGSSMYLTTNQELSFTPGIESKLVTGPYDGKNILLSSDRIIFNTKSSGDIGMFSNNNVSIGAVNEVVVESPVTKIGSTSASEPMVLGNKLETVLNDILTLIETGLLAPTGPVQVVPGQAILQKLKSALGVPSIKSPKNLVE